MMRPMQTLTTDEETIVAYLSEINDSNREESSDAKTIAMDLGISEKSVDTAIDSLIRKRIVKAFAFAPYEDYTKGPPAYRFGLTKHGESMAKEERFKEPKERVAARIGIRNLQRAQRLP